MLRGAYVGHVAQGGAHRGMGRSAALDASMHAIGADAAAMADAMDARRRGACRRRLAVLRLGFSAHCPDPGFLSFAVTLKRTIGALSGAFVELARLIPG